MAKLTPEQAKSMATIFNEGVVEWSPACSNFGPKCENHYDVTINFVFEWDAEEQFAEMVKADWTHDKDDGWLCPACRKGGAE